MTTMRYANYSSWFIFVSLAQFYFDLKTPLLIAVKTNRADMVQLLVSAGANPNILSLVII